jgi:hypothetical protein
MQLRVRILNRWLCVIVAAFCMFAGAQVRADEKPDSAFAVVVTGGGGLSYFVAEINPPADIPSTIRRGGLSGTLRVMWYPDHLLRVGVESGWTRFFSYSLRKRSEGNLYLSAVPILVVFSMPLAPHLDAFVGAGGYWVFSDLAYESKVRVTEFSQGWMLAGAYRFPIGKTLDLAAELKWLNASQFEDASLTLQVHVVWRAFEW